MFWSILLGWALIGMVLEAAACMCTVIYAAACVDSAGFLDNSTAENAFRNKVHGALKNHFRWSGFLYKILPRFAAGVIELCWMFIVWPFEVPKIILDLKRASDEFQAEYNVSQ